MSQHDFDIINQSSGAFRIDLNLALKAPFKCARRPLAQGLLMQQRYSKE